MVESGGGQSISVSCGVMQSILTGESGSVEKHVAAVKDRKAVYQDKTCLMFSVRMLAPHLPDNPVKS